MELIRGLHNLRPRAEGAIVTIGNFDGVHRGHQAMLERLHAHAARLGGAITVITFEPHPLEFFRPEQAPTRLTPLRDKLALLSAYGVERVVCLRFNQALANMPAEAFVEQVLQRGLNTRYLLVGDDFRFGAQRRGDYALLAEAGRRDGFEVERMHTVAEAGDRISSTRIREALARKDLDTAKELLGRPYQICGRVRRGRALGQQLGVPTANIGFDAKQRPPMTGIFAARVHGLERPYIGAASLGYRPTVDGREPLLEVHLLDFQGNLYGRHIGVEFVRHLRDEERFDSLAELKAQMALDIERTRAVFARHDD